VGVLVTQSQLLEIRAAAKRAGQTVVFTNGCFDLIHRGHVELLNRAKALGDILIVGLNTDASMRRIKGDSRPILPQEDRAFLLINLRAVDYVCFFEEDTPEQMIRALRPDVLVKGADYQLDQVVGADIVQQAGGRVVLIDLIQGRSTTGLIELILERFGR